VYRCSWSADLESLGRIVAPSTRQPPLAGALLNQATSRLLLGRAEDALVSIEESVLLHRTLAERHPALHLPDLARSLLLGGRILDRLGRREAALQRLVEAVGAAHRTKILTLIARARATLEEMRARR